MAWHTPAEVAAMLKLDVVTVRRKCKAGEIDAARPAGRWRISDEALQAWLIASTRVRPLKPSAPRARVRSRSSNFGRALQAINNGGGS